MCGLITALGCSSDSASVGGPGDGNYKAKIIRTTYGIPHVSANDFGSLGFGAGYAYAQDNFCVLMAEVQRANGKSTRYFGEDGGSVSRDYVYSFLNTDEAAEEFKLGTEEVYQALVLGYATGINKYLEDTGVENLAEGPEGCRDAEWVRALRDLDLWKVYNKLVLLGSTEELASIVPSAEPTLASMASAADPLLGGQSTLFDTDAIVTPRERGLGSNAYAIGTEGSQTGHGILLGNPHFPWSGPLRFYLQHLTIPNTIDVMGAGLHGVPAVLIGFNKDVAWSHTVSTANRFTIFELDLLEDDPMKYRYDDEIRDIVPHEVTIEVLLEDGTIEQRTDTLYTSHYGFIVDLGPIDDLLAGWPNGTGTVFTYGDANLGNNRIFDLWFGKSIASSLEEVQEAMKATIANPWTNTITVDRNGNGMYADVSVVPNVTAEQLTSCSDSVLTSAINASGLPALNGSRSECEWGTDSDAPVEGLFGWDNLPKLLTGPDVPYVGNSNDSYWVATGNPDDLLEGFSPVIGQESIEQSLRTRQAFVQADDRIAGTDGLSDDPGFTVELLQQVMFRNRNLGEELVRDDMVTICERVTDWGAGDCDPDTEGNQPYSANPEEAAQACAILDDWDGYFNNDSVGATLFFETWLKLCKDPGERDDEKPVCVQDIWEVPFDAADPVRTPNTLKNDNPTQEAVLCAIGGGVDSLVDFGIPLDLPWGEVQFRWDGPQENPIPIHGGPGLFMFSNVGSSFVEEDGAFSDISESSNSYIQTVTWDETECPDAYAVLTYSQSTNPESPHYADMTQLYSDKGWNDLPFCAADIEADKISEIEITGSEN
jgi:acyl-homoserine-lactone acylase